MKKVIVITGGSQGLGKETARLLSHENQVVVISNEKESLDQVIEELKIDGYFADISFPDQIEKIFTEIISKHKRIDVLINNAGIWLGGELETNNYSDIAKVLMVNSLGTVYASKAVIPYMKKQGNGKIINIGSTNGIETKSERSVYIASKWAITGFSGALRKELEPYNIGVVCMSPGLMSTNLHRNAGTERDYECAMEPSEVAKMIEFVVNQDKIVVEQLIFRGMHCEVH